MERLRKSFRRKGKEKGRDASSTLEEVKQKDLVNTNDVSMTLLLFTGAYSREGGNGVVPPSETLGVIKPSLFGLNSLNSNKFLKSSPKL